MRFDRAKDVLEVAPLMLRNAAVAPHGDRHGVT
jgi:hypothetical protein